MVASRFSASTFGATLLVLSALSSSAAAQVTLPYSQNFDTFSTCSTSSCTTTCNLPPASQWQNATTGDTAEWTVDAGGTGSFGTGPSGDHTTGSGNYLYLETSGSCSGGDDIAWLYSPVLDLTSATSPAVRFWYHMRGDSMGTLSVDVLDTSNNVLAADVFGPITDNVDLWQRTPYISLAAYTGQMVKIRIRGISGSSYTSDMAIDDFELVTPPPLDLGVQNIDSPIGYSCSLSNATPISVTLKNYGSADQSGFTVEYTINGGAPVQEVFAGTLAAGLTAPFTFATPADLSAVGSYNLTVKTILAGDGDASNDQAATTTVLGGTPITSYPYLDDFEGIDQWTTGGNASSWARGTPAAGIINSAHSGSNAWVTNLTGQYNQNETSWVQNAHCFDFSAVANPAISVTVWYQTSAGDDGGRIESSIDGGATWQLVGALNDPVNWYNDGGIDSSSGQVEGWAGSSNGWVSALHSLPNLGGKSSVLLRVAFIADSFNQNEGFAFDDVKVVSLNNSNLAVNGTTAGTPLTASLPGANDVVVQAFDLTDIGPGAAINSIHIVRTGTTSDADITAAKLWSDNGDGAFDAAADTLIDTQLFAAGGATFNTMGALSAGSFAAQRVFITFDLSAATAAAATFGSSIVAPTTDIVTAGNVGVSSDAVPLAGPLLAVAGVVSTLPFEDDFGGTPPNRTATFASGIGYPQAFSPGTSVSQATPNNDARLRLVSEQQSLTPISGPSFLRIDYPNGFGAVGAIEYRFDLSSFSAASDSIELNFRWADIGQNNSNYDNVFISLDGGATWAASLFKFPWTVNDNSWVNDSVNISALLTSYGLDFSNDVVLRLQAHDTNVNRPFFLDRVLVGRAAALEVEREPNTPIADEGSDVLGEVAATSQSIVYTIHNAGDIPLAIAGSTIKGVNSNNVTNIVVTPPDQSMLPLVKDGSVPFQVDYEPGVGAFSFELEFYANATHLSDNRYNITISGNGNENSSEIDVQRPADTSIASGMTDPQDVVAINIPQTLNYTVASLGFLDLHISGVDIANSTNVAAAVTMQPDMLLTTGNVSNFEVDYTVTAAGPFSFDVIVNNDDIDEGTYIITVNGDGDDGMGVGGGGGGGAAGGAAAASSSAPASATGSGGNDSGGAGGDEGGGGGDGCSCHTSGGGHSPWGAGALMLLAAAIATRRRRQQRG